MYSDFDAAGVRSFKLHNDIQDYDLGPFSSIPSLRFHINFTSQIQVHHRPQDSIIIIIIIIIMHEQITRGVQRCGGNTALEAPFY